MSSAASSASSAASPPSSRPLTSKQAARTYRQLCDFGWDMDKYVFLDQLHDRNETLYYRVLTGHLAEPLPVVYDPTVGEAIKLWSREYRRSRAVYLSVDRIEDVRPSLEGLGLGPDDVDLLVVSDAEEILGNRHARVRGQRYDALVEEYLSAAAELFPPRAAPLRGLRAVQRPPHPAGQPGEVRHLQRSPTTTCRAPVWPTRSTPVWSATG